VRIVNKAILKAWTSWCRWGAD